MIKKIGSTQRVRGAGFIRCCSLGGRFTVPNLEAGDDDYFFFLRVARFFGEGWAIVSAAFFFVARFFVDRFLVAFFLVAFFLVDRLAFFLAAFFFVERFLVERFTPFFLAAFFVERFAVFFFVAIGSGSSRSRALNVRYGGIPRAR